MAGGSGFDFVLGADLGGVEDLRSGGGYSCVAGQARSMIVLKATMTVRNCLIGTKRYCDNESFFPVVESKRALNRC